MGNLSQFRFDVFLSYGWAGIDSPEHGDRGWVGKLKTALALELSGNLGRAPRIFLDVEQPRSGHLPPRLDEAISSSLLFLSVITPGAVREDSWCRWEIKRFFKEAAMFLPNAGQVFVARLRDVPRSDLPDELRDIVPYDFMTQGTYRNPLPEPNPEDLSTGSGPMLRDLARAMAGALTSIAANVERTFFLAAASAGSQQGLSNIVNLITGRAQEVVTATYEPGSREQSFLRQISGQLRRCGSSVHVLNRDMGSRPKEWTSTPQLLQLKLAKEWLGTDRNRVIVVADPNSPPPESYIELMTSPKELAAVGFRHIGTIMRTPTALPSESNLLASQVRRATYRVAISNASNSVSDAEVEAGCAALQIQIRRDFAPIWGIDADVTFISKSLQPPADSWLLLVLDDSDFGSMPSYHTLTAEAIPLIKVFITTARQLNFEWTMCASHELLEALADPMMGTAAFVDGPGFRRFYLRQICDPCRDAQYGYQINGLLVSDFVFPAWFETFRKPGSTRFDFAGHIHGPFELTEGAVVKVCEAKGNAWTTVQRPSAAADKRQLKRRRNSR
jgi:hypothetical protein